MEDAFDAIDYQIECQNITDENVDCNSDDEPGKFLDTSDIIYTPKTLNINKIIYITKTGAFIKFDDINYKKNKKYIDDVSQSKAVRKIENYFTLKTMQLIGSFKQSKRCRIDKKKRRIVVPRFGIYEILNDKFGLNGYTTVSQLKSGNDPVNPFVWEGHLKPNQSLISNYIINNIYTKTRTKLGSAGCIINLEAGQGKSYVAAYLMSVINKKTAIVIHSTCLMDQWKAVISNCYKNITVGTYYGKKKTDGDVVIIVINSALSESFKVCGEVVSPIEYFNQFGFIIYDECHLYANTNAGKAFSIAQTPYVLGLSATPDENINKFDKIVWWSLGPVIETEKLVGYQKTDNEFTGSVHRIIYYGLPRYTRLIRNAKTDMVSIAETMGMICEDESRTNVVINCIKDCLKKKLFTFVFADRRNYLDTLKIKLIEDQQSLADQIETMIDEKDYIRIVGGSKSEELKQAEIRSKVIFTTYQFMGTGKSISKMNGLVLATPRKSKMKQYIKRIFRLGSDADIERHIYDIVDMKTVLKNQWYVRNKYYKSMHFTINEKKYDANVAPIKIETDTSDKICSTVNSKICSTVNSKICSTVLYSKMCSMVNSKMCSMVNSKMCSKVNSKMCSKVNSKMCSKDYSLVAKQIMDKINK